MVITDTIEWLIDGTLWFHVDVANDVLHLLLADRRNDETTAEEDADGLLVLRSERDDRVVGLTVLDWWKRSGGDELTAAPLGEVEKRIALWAPKLAA